MTHLDALYRLLLAYWHFSSPAHVALSPTFSQTKKTRQKKCVENSTLGGGPDRVIFHTFFAKKN